MGPSVRPPERMFCRTIGIDYSGADTPITRTAKLQVYSAYGNDAPERVCIHPPRRGAKHWHRRGIAEWLVDELANSAIRTIVGIDHAFSFPIDYLRNHGLLGLDWEHFLGDFRDYWPTDDDNALVRKIKEGPARNHTGDPTWRRLTDERATGAKSPFQFGPQGSVAHSTHAGLPWLRHIRRGLETQVHFWPFDGWDIHDGKSVIAEVYPALWNRRFRSEGRSEDEHDAYSIAAWLSHADRNGWLHEYFHPNLDTAEKAQARQEGWILGALGYIDL